MIFCAHRISSRVFKILFVLEFIDDQMPYDIIFIKKIPAALVVHGAIHFMTPATPRRMKNKKDILVLLSRCLHSFLHDFRGGGNATLRGRSAGQKNKSSNQKQTNFHRNLLIKL